MMRDIFEKQVRVGAESNQAMKTILTNSAIGKSEIKKMTMTRLMYSERGVFL